MKAINKQDLINYLKKSPENLNFNIFGTMLEDFRNTYETDEQIVNKIKGIITNIIEDGSSISPEDDTITELVDLITELLPEKMIIKPVGTLEITENGTDINIANYALADVDVPTYESDLINLIERDITSFNIPQGVTTIGNMSFSNCGNLESVNIPSTVTSIGDGALQTTALTTVNIPEGVTSIGANAFSNCQDLTSVYIPVSMTNIGVYAFVNDNALTDIYYAGTQAQWEAITMGTGAIPAGVTVHYKYTPE